MQHQQKRDGHLTVDPPQQALGMDLKEKTGQHTKRNCGTQRAQVLAPMCSCAVAKELALIANARAPIQIAALLALYHDRLVELDAMKRALDDAKQRLAGYSGKMKSLVATFSRFCRTESQIMRVWPEIRGAVPALSTAHLPEMEDQEGRKRMQLAPFAKPVHEDPPVQTTKQLQPSPSVGEAQEEPPGQKTSFLIRIVCSAGKKSDKSSTGKKSDKSSGNKTAGKKTDSGNFDREDSPTQATLGEKVALGAILSPPQPLTSPATSSSHTVVQGMLKRSAPGTPAAAPVAAKSGSCSKLRPAKAGEEGLDILLAEGRVKRPRTSSSEVASPMAVDVPHHVNCSQVSSVDLAPLRIAHDEESLGSSEQMAFSRLIE